MLRSTSFAIAEQPTHETIIAIREKGMKSAMDTWNKSEYLSAIQKDWINEGSSKTSKF